MPGGLEVKVDATELRKLFADLKAAGNGLQVDLRRGVKSGGNIVADAVKGASSWSSRIPGAVQTKAKLGANPSVAVIVNAGAAPEAAPLNNKDAGGSFYHPVWGQGTTSQQARPFFGPAVAASAPAAVKAIEEVMDELARKAGFR